MFVNLKIVSKMKSSIADFGYVFLVEPSHSAAGGTVSDMIKQARIMLELNYDETLLALTFMRCRHFANDSLSSFVYESAHRYWVNILKPTLLFVEQFISVGLRNNILIHDIRKTNMSIHAERSPGF